MPRRAWLHLLACFLVPGGLISCTAQGAGRPGAAGSCGLSAAATATACSIAGCLECDPASSQECLACAEGTFGFKYGYDQLSTRPFCLSCTGLGCAAGGCADLEGCSSCPKGAVLTVDFASKTAPGAGIKTYSLPTRCQRCSTDLSCATCADHVGCTTCPLGFIKTSNPASMNYTACASCQALGCTECADGQGCTSCPAGSFLYSQDEGRLSMCKNATELNCLGPATRDQGCTACPDGFVLSQPATAFPLPPARCLSATGDLGCLESDDSGCTSCAADGAFLSPVLFDDLNPRNECRNAAAELGCATAGDEGCTACPSGQFVDGSSWPAKCISCSSALACGNCGAGGCSRCALASFLRNSSVFPGMLECSKCEGCMSECSAEGGCQNCNLGFFRKSITSLLADGVNATVGTCISAAAHKCASVEDEAGCTSCQPGYYEAEDKELGITTCKKAAARLGCSATAAGTTSCQSCAAGSYRCNTMLPNGEAAVGCCPCTGCARCEDFKGCTACPHNFQLAPLPAGDPYYATSALAATGAGAAETTFTCTACNSSKAAAETAMAAGTVPATDALCGSCPAGMFLAAETAAYVDCQPCDAKLGCTACNPLTGCEACSQGTYLAPAPSASGLTANISSCLTCHGCLGSGCADGIGCTACLAAQSVFYDEAPQRRCYDVSALGLNCAADGAADGIGCTACPEGSFLDRPSLDSPFYCASCPAILGCPEGQCDMLRGCTSCGNGTSIKLLSGAYWNDVQLCVPDPAPPADESYPAGLPGSFLGGQPALMKGNK